MHGGVKKGQLNLVFDNTSGRDYHLYTGRGLGHFEVVPEKDRIVVQAVYEGCVLQSVHNCYHADVFNVPAGQIRTLHLGPAPASLKGYPAESPGVYQTYPPGEGLAPHAPRESRGRAFHAEHMFDRAISSLREVAHLS